MFFTLGPKGPMAVGPPDQKPSLLPLFVYRVSGVWVYMPQHSTVCGSQTTYRHLLIIRIQESNLGHQAWQPAPSPTEPSSLPSLLVTLLHVRPLCVHVRKIIQPLIFSYTCGSVVSGQVRKAIFQDSHLQSFSFSKTLIRGHLKTQFHWLRYSQVYSWFKTEDKKLEYTEHINFPMLPFFLSCASYQNLSLQQDFLRV